MRLSFQTKSFTAENTWANITIATYNTSIHHTIHPVRLKFLWKAQCNFIAGFFPRSPYYYSSNSNKYIRHIQVDKLRWHTTCLRDMKIVHSLYFLCNKFFWPLPPQAEGWKVWKCIRQYGWEMFIGDDCTIWRSRPVWRVNQRKVWGHSLLTFNINVD